MGGRRFVSVSRVAVFTLFLLFTRSIDVVSVEQIDGEDSEHLLDSNVKYNFSWVACYVFMEGNVKRGYANVSLNDVYELHQMFEQLKHAVVDTPFGEEVQVLKLKFINKLKSYGLLPGELSRDDVYLALNPEWLGRLQNKAWLQTIFLKNLLGYSNTAFFCSIASEGSGRTFPVILLPRPRAVMFWKATSEYDYGTVTTVGEIMNGRGFIATGSQTGTAIGFLGIGLTFGTPFGPIYGFIGYALMVRVTAEDIQSYPPNAAPIISEVNPPNGERDVPPTLSKLSFKIEDPDGDRMSYTVETIPDIGSSHGVNKRGGVYTVTVAGLKKATLYKWYINVTDGKDWTKRVYTFRTKASKLKVFYPTDDAYITSTKPDYNTGTVSYLAIRNGGSENNWASQPVIRFDISLIPPTAKVGFASLRLFYRDYSDTNPAGRELNIYRLLDDWNEESITWNNKPSNFEKTTFPTFVPSSPGAWMEWEVTADVQDFVTGEVDNYGWIIKDEQCFHGAGIPNMYCNSKEYGSNIPVLEIGFAE